MQSTISDTQSKILDGKAACKRLALSIVAAAVISVGMWAAILVLPNIQADFGADRADASMAFTMAMVGFASGNFVLGYMVDRYGIAPILLGASLLASTCYVLSTLATSIWIFCLLQLPIGFATAAGFGPMIADISHWFSRYRGIAVAATASGNYIAGTIWPLLLKAPIEDYGWRFAFIIMAVACVIITLPLAYLLRQTTQTDTKPGQTQTPVKSLPFSPTQLTLLLLIAGLGCCLAMAMPQVHIVAYCVDLGFGAGVGAQMLSLMLATGIIRRLASGWLADYIGGVPTLLIGSLLQCLALFLYIPFDGLASLYLVSLIFGLSQGGIVPAYAIIIREYLPANEAGKRIGIIMLATVSGMALGGWASGFIYDMTGSYQMAFIHGILWNLINIAVMVTILILSKPPKPLSPMAI